jgi:glycosyltransferase involved in cell wall biosynthesis
MISVVIPTLNEQSNIGKLLDCLIAQRFPDLEVIVVDCKSEDKTQQVVRSYKSKIPRLRLLVSKVRNVSYQRNYGAEEAKGSIILFLDADVSLPKGFLQDNVKEFNERHLDTAGCYVTPLSSKAVDKVYHFFLNAYMWAFQAIFPHMPGFCIFTTKNMHKKLKGFDPTIKLSEDSDYVCRTQKNGRFRMLKSARVYCSVRRFEKDGRLKMGIKYFLVVFYRLFLGEIRTDVFKYKFGEYKEK